MLRYEKAISITYYKREKNIVYGYGPKLSLQPAHHLRFAYDLNIIQWFS